MYNFLKCIYIYTRILTHRVNTHTQTHTHTYTQTNTHAHTHILKKKLFTTVLSPWEIRVAFPRKSQLRQSRATQPTVHSGCFSVSITHRTLTWTTGYLTCAQMLMHAIAHGGVRTHVKESALKVDSGRKIPSGTGEWSYIPYRSVFFFFRPEN